ncbi:MAG: GAF domain-containing sensor histidine kinase [Proteobacteria bacterium]|nr:GAF domain-containing sensor histidine kinase [Pseudomonadota bacterium]
MRGQIRALCKLGFVLESTMSLDEVLTRIIEQTDHLMDAERSTLYTVTEGGGLVSRIIESGEIAEIALDPGQGIAGWVARSGHPLNVPNVRRDERFDSSWDKRTGFTTHCVLCHPIRNQSGKVIGVIETINKRDGAAFDESDLELLRLIAGQLALIIENSSLMLDLIEKNVALVEAKQSLERSNRELDLLLDIERRVAYSEDMDSLAVSILKRVIDVTHAQVGLLYRPDETGAKIRVVVKDSPTVRVLRVEHGTGISGWVATKGQELNLVAPTADPRFADQLRARIDIVPENVAAVPLLNQEEGSSHGSILVANKKFGDSFEDADMALLRLVAKRLSQALEDLSSRRERERERRLATVGRLLAGVLHDIRTPISVISGYAELLAAKAGGAEGQEYLDHLNKALNRITTMTEEIIAFSKGERRILISNILLEDFTEDFIKQIQQHLEINNIKLVTGIRLQGSVHLDRDKMLRVFHNIVRNAIEEMESGGTLTFEVDQLGDEIVFGFTDTGGGVPEEVQGSLFQSFVTLGKRQGTGLGLSVAREIVQAHGGKISFTTINGKGTTFLVSLPYKTS